MGWGLHTRKWGLQTPHHHRDEWSFCSTQTLTHTQPQFSQSDTSIRLILPAYKMLLSFSLNRRCWRHAIFPCCFACSASQVEEILQWWREPERSVPLPGGNTEEEMQGSRERETEGEREGGSGNSGRSREAKRQSSASVCFPLLHIPQAHRRQSGSLQCKLLI